MDWLNLEGVGDKKNVMQVENVHLQLVTISLKSI
jgi:hypothetical protein